MSGSGKTRALTERQRRFAEEYLIDLDAAQAAIRAGYAPASAQRRGAALLAAPAVRAAIDGEMLRRSERTGITADRVLTELARIAFADPEVPNGQSALPQVAGLKVKLSPGRERGEDGTPVMDMIVEREILLRDKLRALDMLSRHLGLYEKKQSDTERESGVVLLPARGDG